MSKIRNTSGISLVALILSIVVMSIIATIIITTNIGEDSVIVEAQSAIQRLSLEEKRSNLALEIESFKTNLITNNDKFIVDMLVPILQKYGTINYSEGKIVSVTTPTNDVILLSDYIKDEDLITYGVIELNITYGTYTFEGLQLTIDNDGYITLNGRFNSNISRYIKITNGVVCGGGGAAAGVNSFDEEGPILETGRRIKCTIESDNFDAIKPLTSGEQEFNVCLRDPVGLTAVNKIMLLGNNDGYQYPPGNAFENLNVDISAVYIYIKNRVQFENFKFKYVITEEIAPPPVEDIGTMVKENSLNMAIGQAQWLGSSTPGFTVEVLPDYTIKLNGTPSTAVNTYIAFLEDKTYLCLSSYNPLLDYYWENTPLVAPNTRMRLTIKEISGTKTVNSSKQVNFLLRNATGPSSTPASAGLLNIKMASGNPTESGYVSPGIYCLEGTYATESKVFGGYIERGAWSFDNYIIKPTLEILE